MGWGLGRDGSPHSVVIPGLGPGIPEFLDFPRETQGCPGQARA